MKKWILIPCGLGAVVVGAAAALLVSINPIVEAGVNKFGPEITGTHVFLKEADISVFSGEGKLNEFLIGNPKGYTAPHALKVGSVRVALDKATLLEDVIVIKKIAIDSPDIVYELGKKSNNFDDIIANVEELGAADERSAAEDLSATDFLHVVGSRTLFDPLGVHWALRDHLVLLHHVESVLGDVGGEWISLHECIEGVCVKNSVEFIAVF